MGFDVTPDVFLEEFTTWTRGFLPGAQELLTALNGQIRLACLSNSNAAHWQRNAQDHGIFAFFEAALSSHQLGFHKPDAAIFKKALSMLGVEPKDVVFFDDAAVNVLAAQQFGIMSFQVNGITELHSCLEDLDLLTSP